MALFQRAVQKDALASLLKLDGSKIAQAYQIFIQQFGNPTFQQNVRAAKEEQYQEGFLNDLFVKVLGYTLHPQPAFDLITEQKNLKNAKKADGAILRDAQPIAVIELKSMRTIDLQTIEIQAFAYKNNQPTARYVITSNFQKLRFYIDDATEFEEFDLFALAETDFNLLYACLHKTQLLADAPAQLKIASLHKTEQITQDLYVAYSKFKAELFLNLKQWNRQHNALTLFKISQKLLDRFLFFCFAKDKGLLRRETLKEILDQYDGLKKMDEAKPLYDIFKKYFRYLNNGYSPLNIFGYNGGLFAPDPLLDSLTISDGLLYTNIPILGKYDFDSDVDTNILGHIFEHSLNELDEKTAQAVGQTADKSKSKRKKDGIFYTPRYITQYIVEQTIGALCQQKQVELAIDRLDWWDDCPSAIAIMRLHTYRGWLLQVTVLDPACGSGAFLNQAFVFLRAEHRRIDAMLATLTGKSVENTDWATHILDHNLFGVDINEESVEIAKLSLWLRTAKVGRKLNDLSANIQVGNSLISDPEVAGALAFDWQKGFPQVFEKGGFDVVIGNPPYVRVQYLNSKDIDFYFNNYKTPTGKLDISILFFERCLTLIKEIGLIGFISSSQWMQTDYGRNLRKILSQGHIQKIIDFGSLPVFENVETYPAIFVITKIVNELVEYKLATQKSDLDTQKIADLIPMPFKMEKLTENVWQFGSLDLTSVIKNKNIPMVKISDIGNSYIGDLTGFDKAFVVNDSIINNYKLEKDIIFFYAYRGEEIEPFTIVTPKASVIYPYFESSEGKSVLIPIEDLQIKYPNIYNYLLQYKSDLLQRMDSRKQYAFEDNWYRHVRQGTFKYIRPNKLAIKGIDTKLTAGLLMNNTIFNGSNCPAIIIDNCNFDNNYILALLNSKLITFYLNSICPKKLGGYFRYNATNLAEIPIPDIQRKQQQLFISLSEQMFILNAQLREAQTDFLNLLQDEFTGLKRNKAIENWHESDFATLKKAMEKQKGVTFDDLNSVKKWRKQFDLEKTAYTALQQQIAATDKAIDTAVYALYELTPEEIQLIENQ